MMLKSHTGGRGAQEGPHKQVIPLSRVVFPSAVVWLHKHYLSALINTIMSSCIPRGPDDFKGSTVHEPELSWVWCSSKNFYGIFGLFKVCPHHSVLGLLTVLQELCASLLSFVIICMTFLNNGTLLCVILNELNISLFVRPTKGSTARAGSYLSMICKEKKLKYIEYFYSC